MPSDAEFSPADWAILRELPFIVILGAIVSDEGSKGWHVAKETAVAAHQLISDAKTQLDNPLILHVLTELAEGGTDSGDREVDLDDEGARSSAMDAALAASAAAAAVLNRAANDQAQAYKQWVYNAAFAATRAIKTGGVLGIGENDISEGETAFLLNLGENLGLTVAGAD